MINKEIHQSMKIDSTNELGQALKAARHRAGLTVRDVAAKAGMTPATVSRIETGQIEAPRPAHLRRLATALDLELEDLYGLAGYLMPEGLPELRPYLRAKYDLPTKALDQIDEYFQALRSGWELSPNKEGHHDRGDQNP
jgi:transcriptional regulator with XRE-family HTH domain